MHSGSVYTPEEEAWVERRTRRIAVETGLPLPIARAQAAQQLIWNRNTKPKADVITLEPRKLEPDD